MKKIIHIAIATLAISLMAAKAEAYGTKPVCKPGFSMDKDKCENRGGKGTETKTQGGKNGGGKGSKGNSGGNDNKSS